MLIRTPLGKDQLGVRTQAKNGVALFNATSNRNCPRFHALFSNLLVVLCKDLESRDAAEATQDLRHSRLIRRVTCDVPIQRIGELWISEQSFDFLH